MARRTLAACVTVPEYDAFTELAKRHNVPMSTYLRAIVVDALVEEGFVFVQRIGKARGTSGREGFEASGGPAA